MPSKTAFEDNLKKLQEIIEHLESDEPSLEKVIGYYEEGMQLLSLCRTQLTEVENRIATLKEENDNFHEKPGIESP
jgi:exodeoxyribonuclease VII small subunit